MISGKKEGKKYDIGDQEHDTASQEANEGSSKQAKKRELVRKMSPKTQLRDYKKFKKDFKY